MTTQLSTVKLRLVFSITIFFVWFYGNAQNDYWKEEVSNTIKLGRSLDGLKKSQIKVFSLNREAFSNKLKILSPSKKKAIVVYFPDEKGKMIPFMVREKSVMAPELAAKFPNIKSYVGESSDGSGRRLRFSLSHKGLQSMILHKDKSPPIFSQKLASTAKKYIVYARNPEDEINKNFICSTEATIEKAKGGLTSKLVDGQVLRKFRLAVSTTGEYTTYHGGAVADALAAINATVTRINEVFERDLAVTLELISNTDEVVFVNAANDPYTTSLGSQVQSTLTNVIGENNYDMGILFHEAPNNGDAGFIGRVCVDNQKGSAFAAGTTPEGDIFDLDFVAHEMGHQLGANHTWSFRSEGTSVQAEPASGTTIMGYAGIAQGNNVATNGDDYFHYYSILQIQENLATKTCPELISLANTPPTIVPVNDYIIPKSTAFVLTGTATDPDTDDVLTYAWEQIDDGVVVTATFGPTNPSGANFRSRPPATDPERYFPLLPRIVQGNLTQTNPPIGSAWETVSDVEREMNFALTVRDNNFNGGQVASELVRVSVVDNAGPFAVTSQNTNESYVAGSVQDVTWDVAGTDSEPVNAGMVDIFLSIDGGLTFPIVLADDVPNDGMHPVLLPGTATANARIMVKASENIFLAVNSSDFSITESEVVLNFSELDYEVCKPDDLIISFNYETYLGFNEEVTFTTVGEPSGLGVSFSPTTATVNNTNVDITFSNTTAVPIGDYPITIRATSTSITKDVVLNLGIYDNNFSTLNLLSPLNGSLDVSINADLQWEATPTTNSYDIEIALEPGFTNIIESANVVDNNYTPHNLIPNTAYFWRVKPKNSCGEGSFSDIFTFTTIQISCKTVSAKGLPITISPIATPTVISKITFLEELLVSDININLSIEHSFLEDLVIRLKSPSGNTAVLVSNSCGDLRNINATFDDDASAFICNGNPAISGTVKPLGSLAVFNGESIKGEWTLEIVDTQASDGGALNGFSLDICVEGEFRPDDDQDGVFDDGDDLCLGTPIGLDVNTDGCPIYRFPTDNFEIMANSESCRNNNDGSIAINAMDNSINYIATVDGNGINDTSNFTNSYALSDLSAGEYTVCITGTLGTINYEPLCVNLVITEPDALGVTSRLLADSNQVLLTLEGSDFYNVELNGIVQQTNSSEFLLDLKNGLNTLKVSTNLPCQGVYQEDIYGFTEPLVYPNPILDKVKIYVGEPKAQELHAAIYSIDGKLISNKRYSIDNREISLDFKGFTSGIYFIRLTGLGNVKTFKVIKK